MGCSNSKSTTTTAAAASETLMSSKAGEATEKEQKQRQQQQQQKQEEYPQSEAFSIPFDNVNATDAAKKPPKRIQALLTSAEENSPLTLAELQEKQERADQRRQELLAEKLATIQRNTQMLMHNENVASTSTADDLVDSDVGSGGVSCSYRKQTESQGQAP